MADRSVEVPKVAKELQQTQPPPEKGPLSWSNWNDQEIFAENQDRFSTQHYANVLAGRVATADTPLDTPLTIGIFGRWGSGKTSLMKLTEAVLPAKTETGGKIHSLWINVWQLSNQDEVWHALLQALFSKVHRELPCWQRIDKGKLLRQLLSNSYRIVLVITPMIVGVLLTKPEAGWEGILQLVLNPIAGGSTLVTIGLGLWMLVKPIIAAAHEVVNFDLEAVLKYASYEAQVTELMRLQGRFEEMVEVLVGEKGRLVVFIDDLDRCTPDKVPEILEAIKLFTTAKRCVYVLGLDYDIVRQGIELKYGFKTKTDAEEYLEKIVQIPFRMPPLDEGKIKEFLRVYDPNLPQRCPTAPEVFSVGLEPNPRQVKRALNIYRTLLDLAEIRWQNWEMDHPIEPELLAKMVVIQNRFRNLYDRLIKGSDLLLDLERAARDNKPPSNVLEGEESTDLTAELKDLAIEAVLRSGKVFFQELGPGQMSSYIYLTSTAEGAGPGVRASSRERRALLGGNPEEIKNQVDEILKRGDSDKQVQQRIRQAYVVRLERVLNDFEQQYTTSEQMSANIALGRLEEWKREDFEPETVRVPAGPFLMGSDPQKDKEAGENEQPQHPLSLLTYRIGKYPVTNAEYAAFVQATGQRPPEHWKDKEASPGKENHPVVYISWDDAVAYCRWLAQVTGKAYRLPSEAEWEKAARGTKGRIYPWGNEWDAQRCNTGEGGKYETTPVGAYPTGASPYGLLDMAGNVWEWCATKWVKPYPYVAKDEWTDDYLKGEVGRVERGGSFVSDLNSARCAYRSGFGLGVRFASGNGFRVAVSPIL